MPKNTMYMCNIGITRSSAFAGIGSSRDAPLPEPNNGCFGDYVYDIHASYGGPYCWLESLRNIESKNYECMEMKRGHRENNSVSCYE